MKTTKQLVDDNNYRLKLKLIPVKNSPIFGTVSNLVNDDIFNLSFEEILKKTKK